MATIRTDHDMTRMLQGIAIIFMIIHHLPISGIDGGEPLVTSILGRYFVSNMKICVGIYTFLIGFGYYFTSKKNYHTAGLRIMRFLKRWWGLFFIIFLPIGLILDSYILLMGCHYYIMLSDLEKTLIGIVGLSMSIFIQ